MNMTDVSHLAILSRYCSSRTIKDGLPTTYAFWIKPDEKYLSVNVLPDGFGVEVGLAQIRKLLAKKEFNTRPNGRFAVFNAGYIIQHIHEYKKMHIRIKHMPSYDDPTHAGIVPADTYDANARYESTFGITLALTQFCRNNPDCMYPIQ